MKANNLPLRFTIEILGANFVTTGRYFLTLRIVGSTVDPSTLKLYVGNSKEALDDHEFTTDACLEDGDPNTLATFTDSSISFWMPPESTDGDVQLVLEAFRLPENPMHEGDKCGEAVFDVFPRQSTLFSEVRKTTPPNKDSNELYLFQTNITLSQVLEDEGFSANCGVIQADVSLVEEPVKQGTDPELAQKQEEAGSLANVHSSVEFGFEMERRGKKILSQDREEANSWSILEQQTKAGSLANLFPQICVYSDLTLAELKDRAKKVVNDEEEEVISVWQNTSECSREEYRSPIVEPQQPVKLADNCYEDHKLRRPESDKCYYADEVLSSEAANHGFVESRHIHAHPDLKREYSSDLIEPDVCDARYSPVDLEADSYESMVEQEFQNVPQETTCTDNSSSFVEKKMKTGMRVNGDNNRKGQAAAFTSHRWKQRNLKPVKEPEHIKPNLLPVPGDPGPGPSSAPDTSTLVKTIQESALGSNVNSIAVQHLCGSYLAREGYCEVVVLAHGVLGVPFRSDGRPPQPYIVGKSGKAEARGIMGQSVTHATMHPTQSPSWEELLLIEVREEESKDEVVLLLVADHPSKELLTEYTVPLGHLKPFHQYHLELVQPNSELTGDTRLYITLVKKMDKLPLPSIGSRLYGLEVLLRNVEAPVSSQMGPLIATARIVADWKEYKETVLTHQPRPTGVTLTTIHFPSPHPTSFAVAGVTPAHGAPQVTAAGRPQEQPQWNQPMFFLGDESSLFTTTSALVVEYYPASLVMTKDCWQLVSPVGFSYQTLDQLLLSSLHWDSAKLGLRLDNVPVEGSNLRTAMGISPTVGMVLRLVTEERPDQVLSAAHLPSLPTFRKGPLTGQPGQPSHSIQHQHQDERPQQTPYGLPPMDAVKTMLPQFHSLYMGSTGEPVKEYVPLNVASPAAERGTLAASSQITPEVTGNVDTRTLAVMDNQMKEVDRYRAAMRTMATDLLHVREDCKRLEEANSRLRRELGQHDEISRLMVSSKDLDNVTHSELVQKFVLLKKKLADESSKKQELQTRLQRLQNDLIKKNEMEKEYLKLQEAHEGQQALLQKLQGKVQKAQTIQETCKKQEKVIVKLEQLLAKQGKGQYNGVAETSDSYRALSEENIKLQAEVMQYKEMLRKSEAKQKLPRSPPDKQDQSNGPMSDMERLELYEKLERAEGRIVVLEKQLADNIRKWAKDKAELQMKLNESVVSQKTGYKNSSSSMDILDWHNGPKPPSPSRPLGPRRPSPKLDPLDRR